MFSLEFPKKFQNSFVQEQSYEVSTLKEMDELLKDLIRSALRAFKGICKFFQLLLKCSIWSPDTKKHPRLYYHYFPPVSD